MTRTRLRRVDYLGTTLTMGDLCEVADWIVASMRFQQAARIVTHINVNNFYWLARQPQLRQGFRESDVLLLDGIGLKLGGFVLGLGRVPDVNGTDLFPIVMQHPEARGLRVFLLGGTSRVAHAAADATRQRYPNVRVVGHESGYFSHAREKRLVERVNASGAQLLVLGLGFLRQERFALEHRAALRVSLIWNVGGLFDFLSGHKPRAPLPLRKARLEWLFRFALEPRRMWHRNLVATPWLCGQVLSARLRGTKRRSDRLLATAAWERGTELGSESDASSGRVVGTGVPHVDAM